MHVKSLCGPVGLALVVVLSGCARVSDGTSSSTVAAPQGTSTTSATSVALPDVTSRQRISDGFGTTVLVDAQPVADGRSAMDVLRASTPVETAYGGGFVSGMYGRVSGTSPRRDWMYFVNGVSPGVGAGDYTVRPGDRIWWDFRHYDDATPTLPVAVGSWPEPFVHGYPTTPATVRADAPLGAVLVSHGVRVGTRASSWRVIVGANADLVGRDQTWRRAMADPAAAGLSVRIDRGTISVMSVDGGRMRAVAGAGALAAMVLSNGSPEQGGVVFAVAGVDRSAAVAAARAIAAHPQVLDGRMAVVFDRAGRPLASAGRAAP